MLYSIYLIIAYVLGGILILHIFKTRYLDYYKIVKNESSSIEDKSNLDEKKVVLEKKQKIIIRDPNHTGYKFISGLVRVFLIMIKVLGFFIGLYFCMTLVGASILLALSFMIVKSSIFFGIFISIISFIIFNILVLYLIYKLIMSQKIKGLRCCAVTILTLITFGIGIGLVTIGITNINVVNDDKDNYEIEEFLFEMQDNTMIYGNEFEFVESDNDNIRIVVERPKFSTVYLENNNGSFNTIYYREYIDNTQIFQMLKSFIRDINNNKFVDYFNNSSFTVYTTKENILKLRK